MAFCPLQTAFSQAAAARYRLDALGPAEKLPAQEVVGIGASRVYWLRNPRALPWQSEGGSASLASVPFLNSARLFTSFRQFRNEFDSGGATGRIANAKEGVDQP
jgi:hypothetical protein